MSPLYPYHCNKCGHDHDVTKSMSESGREELCPLCALTMNRVWTSPLFIGTAVESAEYNPGLGKVVKNKKHREELAKRMGVTEIGNDYGSAEKMGQSFDKEREKRREKSWEDA